ncbi:MAG: 4-hydroxy-tetrahydrodipicolinate synthase [Rhodospirillaceae bacterium]|nr:4-hydroxy-tetrahydrodipicolinate synthase [Rhodospirillaceae bacterium]
MTFSGSYTALITPLKNGEVDEKSFQDFVEWQITEGTNGLVPCGTTGESPTLTHGEHKRVTELCIEVAKGRATVMAGAGSNSTAEAMELAVHAEKAGADALLVVTPYYNKPTQEGLFRHYEAINNAVSTPIFIYNIPGRSIVDMSMETMARLAKLANIAGVKDATSDLARPISVATEIGKDFAQLSGEDATAIPFLAAGGHGCISVTSNIAPRLCAQQHKAWAAGDVKGAIDIQNKLMPVHSAMFCESSPGPVKFAAEILGLCSSELRLPLCEISQTSKETVTAALLEAGITS